MDQELQDTINEAEAIAPIIVQELKPEAKKAISGQLNKQEMTSFFIHLGIVLVSCVIVLVQAYITKNTNIVEIVAELGSLITGMVFIKKTLDGETK